MKRKTKDILKALAAFILSASMGVTMAFTVACNKGGGGGGQLGQEQTVTYNLTLSGVTKTYNITSESGSVQVEVGTATVKDSNGNTVTSDWNVTYTLRKQGVTSDVAGNAPWTISNADAGAYTLTATAKKSGQSDLKATETITVNAYQTLGGDGGVAVGTIKDYFVASGVAEVAAGGTVVDNELFTATTESKLISGSVDKADNNPFATKLGDLEPTNFTAGLRHEERAAKPGKIEVKAKENITLRVYATTAYQSSTQNWNSNAPGKLVYTTGALDDVGLYAEKAIKQRKGDCTIELDVAKNDTLVLTPDLTTDGCLWLFGIEAVVVGSVPATEVTAVTVTKTDMAIALDGGEATITKDDLSVVVNGKYKFDTEKWDITYSLTGAGTVSGNGPWTVDTAGDYTLTATATPKAGGEAKVSAPLPLHVDEETTYNYSVIHENLFTEEKTFGYGEAGGFTADGIKIYGADNGGSDTAWADSISVSTFGDELSLSDSNSTATAYAFIEFPTAKTSGVYKVSGKLKSPTQNGGWSMIQFLKGDASKNSFAALRTNDDKALGITTDGNAPTKAASTAYTANQAFYFAVVINIDKSKVTLTIGTEEVGTWAIESLAADGWLGIKLQTAGGERNLTLSEFKIWQGTIAS